VMLPGIDVRFGTERSWDRPGTTITVRGGVAFQTARTLEPLPRDGNPFLPVEPVQTWIHVGGGIQIHHVATDVGFAKWHERYRLLVDFRIRSTRQSETAFDSATRATRRPIPVP